MGHRDVINATGTWQDFPPGPDGAKCFKWGGDFQATNPGEGVGAVGENKE